MAGDQEGKARRAQDGIAVSSGESSAATPKPALGSEGLTGPGGFRPEDVTLPESPLPTTPPSASSDAVTMAGDRAPSSGSPSHPIFSAIGATVFREGDILGGRYEIQKLLGMGGMGAVYKARDMEVERVVGLKVIRPDLAGDPAILARFKQELVLARQVTHKNIIRIYDLNEADGVKFITMEFIEGEDLRSILVRDGKLAPQKAADIVVQMCSGLLAAHVEGVIHRDLKPSNVMCDQAGRVVIMDFGLARTVQGDGMTRTGMMVGTMEYMSPEQAMGKELDASSDQFAVGIIFYELLSGIMPYRADSAIASLVKRTQEQAVPLAEVDPTIPPELSAIVGKCLDRDPAARFASIQELIDEIEIWQGKKRRVGQSVLDRPLPRTVVAKRFPLKWIATGVAAIALSVGTYFVIQSRIHQQGSAGAGTPANKGPMMSVAIMPFYNGTGDASLDWAGSTISDNIISGIGESAHLHSIPADRVQDVLHELNFSPQPSVDASTLKSIHDTTAADTVISGELVKVSNQFRINATLHDLKDGRSIALATDFANINDFSGAIDKLAGQIREKLAATADILKELKANSGHVLTSSVTALRAYDEGLQLFRAGKHTEAVVKFEKATQEDTNFAMAFSKLAETYFDLHNDEQADRASRRAMELSQSQNLPPQDKYRIEANDARIKGDKKKAIAEFEDLTKLNPHDIDAQFTLAKLYDVVGNYEEARKRIQIVLAADPKNLQALRYSGWIEIDADNDQAALAPLNSALTLATLSNNEEEKGAILHYMGIAYGDLKKPEEALRNFQQALDIRTKIQDKSGVVETLNQMALVQDGMGRSDAALGNYKAALKVAREINTKRGLLAVLINLGKFYDDHGNYDEALKANNEALQLARDLRLEGPEAQILNNMGSNYDNKAEYQGALTHLKQAYDIRERLKLPEATEALRNMAEMNYKLGEYETAQSQLLKAIEASRAANDKQSLALEHATMGVLFADLGKYDAALSHLKEAVDGFKQIDDRTWYSVDALTSYGDVLSAVGRGQEGQTYIDEAVKRAAEAKDKVSNAGAYNALGNSYFYRGQYALARPQYEKALQMLGKSAVSYQGLNARIGPARLDIVQGRAQTAVPELKKVMQEASAKGLKALAVRASIFYAEALLATNHAEEARQQLETAVGQADNLNLLLEKARAKYLLGNAVIKTGKPKEAPLYYRETVRILDSIMSQQKSASQLLDRPDLKAMYSETKSSLGGGA